MKKPLVLGCALLLTTSTAFASKSRMTALGQDSNIGSHYISDTRNVFDNAADLNGMTNYTIAEWGATTGADGEGGYFRNGGSLNYGIYLGGNINDRTQNTAKGATHKTTDDLMDIFVGSGSWGARLSYGKNKGSDGTNTYYGVGLGSEMGDLTVAANIDITNESETAGNLQEFKGDLGYDVNLEYDIAGMTAWLGYMANGYETKGTTGTKNGDVSNTKIYAGVGRIHEVSSTSRVFTDVSWFTNEQESGVTTKVKTTTRGLNVNVGFETDANDWLAWRGSFKQDLTAELFGATEGAQTNVAAGATLNFGKLKVDGTIGTSSGTVGSNDFLGTVGVHYWF
ncbi:MAG: hypothetical protein KC493_08080 [Bacteriovoracaceae bacterium]|nr:hypothetical protein [Bacteriovoracaceae bacterium]